MANTIKLKNSGTSSNTPSSLEYGELAINYADGKLFYKDSSGSIVELTAAASPAGSDGQIQYNNGGSLGGASGLYYDDVNSRVGIGTTSPSELLDINAGTSGSVELSTTGGRTIQLTANDSEPYLSVGSTSSHSASIMTNGVRRLTVDSSGNVGIGDTTPSYTLDVNGTGRFTGDLSVNATLITDYIRNDNGNFIAIEGGDGWSLGTNASGEYVWLAAEGGLMIVSSDSNSTSWADREQIRITAEGGIDNRLRVHGYLRTNVSGSYGSIQTANVNSWDGFSINGRVVFMHNDSNNWGIYNDVNDEWMIYGALNGSVELKYNNTTRIWTDNEGGRTDGRHYSTGSNYAYSYYGHSNIAGTGNAIHTPNGIYSTGTNWLYGTILTNGSAIGTTGQQIGDIHAAGWLRTYGQRGWYSQSYGGGWYMIDTTWIRTYNNKRIYSGSGQIRSDAGNGFNGPNLTTTYSYNTLRWNSSNGDFMPYASLTEMKTDITDIGGLLSYLNERSLIYDLRPKIFTEANDRVDAEGNPVYTTRGEYAHGMLAEEVLEVAPELAYYDHNGELLSYGNDALIPDIIAELQRLMPMIEELYGAAHPDWVPPSPRPPERAQAERDRYEAARQQQAITGIEDPSDPQNGLRHIEEETDE